MFFRKLIIVIASSLLVKKTTVFINRVLSSVIPLFSVSINDQTLHAHTLDRLIALLLLKFGILEKMEIDFFKRTIKKGWTVLDIGANIGYPSLLFGKLVGEKGKIFSFEPDKDNLKVFRKNIKLNNIKNIKVIPAAVSDRTGLATLYISSSHSGDHRIYSSGEERRRQDVKTVCLNDYFKPKDKIDFIQIDVQGAEELVFKGMEDLLRKNKNVKILLEFWPEGLEKIGTSPNSFLQRIKRNGFKLNCLNEKNGKLERLTIDRCIELSRKNYDLSLFLIR